jgi:molecular chaperone GrpE
VAKPDDTVTSVDEQAEEQGSSPATNGAAGDDPKPAQGQPPSGPAADLPKPPSERELLTAERDKLREQLLRTAADFDNFRKRTRRDLEDARVRGKDELVRELLPVFDNLELAVSTAAGASDIKSVVDGVRMVLKLFEDSIERVGLTRIKCVGERFDPAVHEALQQIDTAAFPPGTIVNEIAAGYRFGERLVRPARVIVARKPPDPAPDSAQAAPTGATQVAAPEAATAEPGKSEAADTKTEPTERKVPSSKPPAGDGSKAGGSTPP